MAKKIIKEPPPIVLTPNQLSHIIVATVKNIVDIHINVDSKGYHYLLIADCLDPKNCIPVEEEPEDDEDLFDIISAHNVVELNDYFEAVMTITHEDGKMYRAFGTIPIDFDNMADFVDCLGELELAWEQMAEQSQAEEDIQDKIKGKNVVDGNGTVN